MYKLFSRKNRDYGDAFVDYGVIGILVRLGDKIRRAQSITSKEVALVDTESIRDTLIDLHNYAAMAIMIIGPHTLCTAPSVLKAYLVKSQ